MTFDRQYPNLWSSFSEDLERVRAWPNFYPIPHNANEIIRLIQTGLPQEEHENARLYDFVCRVLKNPNVEVELKKIWSLERNRRQMVLASLQLEQKAVLDSIFQKVSA